MAKYLILVLSVVGCAIADDSGNYAAPSGGYAAPTGGYAPAASTGYGPPDTGYSASADYQSSGYDAPSTSYGGGDDSGKELFDLSKLLAVLPLFLAVFAAIILAQLFAPLISLLFGAFGAPLLNIFGPLGTAKIDVIKMILAPIGLTLCNVGTPLTEAGTMGRSSPHGFSLNKDMVDSVATMLYNAVENYSN